MESTSSLSPGQSGRHEPWWKTQLSPWTGRQTCYRLWEQIKHKLATNSPHFDPPFALGWNCLLQLTNTRLQKEEGTRFAVQENCTQLLRIDFTTQRSHQIQKMSSGSPRRVSELRGSKSVPKDKDPVTATYYTFSSTKHYKSAARYL